MKIFLDGRLEGIEPSMPVPQTSVLPLNYSRHLSLTLHSGSGVLSGGNCGITILDYQGYCWSDRDRGDVLLAP